MMSTRTPIAGTDDLDILSAIWILSCNDDNPIITYKGIMTRLDLPETYDVRALVRSRSELFRQGILNSRLRDWKDKLKSGKGRPGWIVEIRDKPEQERVIESISREDVFRNQFRVEPDAPKCELEIIDWGLRHIERLRKDAAEEKEARARKWSSLIIPLASLLVAIVSVVGSIAIQRYSIGEQTAMKQYQISFKPKQEAYSNFMVASALAVTATAAQDQENLMKQITTMESSYYSFEPFLKEAERTKIKAKYIEFLDLCKHQLMRPADQSAADKESFLSKAATYRSYFQDRLYSSLFWSA
jgi:hypothetical protein